MNSGFDSLVCTLLDRNDTIYYPIPLGIKMFSLFFCLSFLPTLRAVLGDWNILQKILVSCFLLIWFFFLEEKFDFTAEQENNHFQNPLIFSLFEWAESENRVFSKEFGTKGQSCVLRLHQKLWFLQIKRGQFWR